MTNHPFESPGVCRQARHISVGAELQAQRFPFGGPSDRFQLVLKKLQDLIKADGRSLSVESQKPPLVEVEVPLNGDIEDNLVVYAYLDGKISTIVVVVPQQSLFGQNLDRVITDSPPR